MPNPRLRIDRLLVVDVEMTCWDGAPPPDELPEIVEIGIAEVLMKDEPRIGRTLARLVRPVRSRPSQFFTDLTGITAAELRRDGRPIGEVMNTIRKEFGGAGKAWAAWGRDDIDIADACHAAGVSTPFSSGFIDLGHIWSMLSGSLLPCGVAAALEGAGLAWEGRRHRAGSDSYNTAKLVVWISEHLRNALHADHRNLANQDAGNLLL